MQHRRTIGQRRRFITGSSPHRPAKISSKADLRRAVTPEPRVGREYAARSRSGVRLNRAVQVKSCTLKLDVRFVQRWRRKAQDGGIGETH